MKMAKICLPKGSGKRLKVREKSVKSQGILKWILSGNAVCVYNKLFQEKLLSQVEHLNGLWLPWALTCPSMELFM